MKIKNFIFAIEVPIGENKSFRKLHATCRSPADRPLD